MLRFGHSASQLTTRLLAEMPGHIDENLLAKLVDKYGLDKEQNASARARLWFRLTKDYNQITNSSFTKSKIAKKWQNVEYRRRTKEKAADNGNDETSGGKVTHRDNLWSVMDHLLRDLFLFLIVKHEIEDIRHPREKSRAWQELAEEFHALLGNFVVVKHEKFSKKWQNWKAYNKAKNLPHPTVQCRDRLNFDVLDLKLKKLKTRLACDKEFAANLSQDHDDVSSLRLEDVMPRDDDTHKGAKSLEKQIAVRKLRNETERFNVIVETGNMERRKIEMETELVSVQLEKAKLDLELKRREFESLLSVKL